MADQFRNPDPVDNERGRQFNVIQTQLNSQRASDILQGINRVRQWLQEDLEDRDVYGLLLNAVEENHGLREQARNLLTEMMEKGSKTAEEALSVLPSSVQDLLADADDAYYAAEYNRAVQLYRQVLKLDPENARAQEHLAKAKIEQIKTGETKTELPRDAVQYYRRARSYIAAGAYLTAMKSLNASVEAAQARGVNYPDAEKLLDSVQDSLVADEFKSKANLAIEKEQWAEALDLINKALALDLADDAIKKELYGLQNLLRAESEFQKWRALKLFSPLSQLQSASETAKSVMNPDNPLLRFVDKQLNQIKLIRIGSVAGLLLLVFIVVAASLGEKIDLFEPKPTTTATTQIAITFTSLPIPTLSETSAPTITAVIATETQANTPTAAVTNTLEFTATPIVLGYGKLTANFFPLETPNGKRIVQTLNGKTTDLQLYRKQIVMIINSKNDHGSTWYYCKWEINGVAGEGWVLGDSIQFVPPPTPTP